MAMRLLEVVTNVIDPEGHDKAVLPINAYRREKYGAAETFLSSDMKSDETE